MFAFCVLIVFVHFMSAFKHLQMNISSACVCMCPFGRLTRESDWQMCEEVSATLQQYCCSCSQSTSPGRQISISMLEVRFQPVCQVILHITNYTDSIIHCFPTGLTPWKTLVLYSQVIVLRIQISHCEENTLKILKCKGAYSIVLLIICSLRTNDLNSGCMAISLPTPMEMIAFTDRLKKNHKTWRAVSRCVRARHHLVAKIIRDKKKQSTQGVSHSSTIALKMTVCH